ncbi:pecanex-like protein 4 [Glandiceps talaboti]
MGNGVPLLNDYKQEFFWKRFPQTVLGGPKVKLGYDAPAYVYINQIVLFLIPWIIGGLFTLFVELDVMKDYIGACVCGACVLLYVLIVQLISLGVRTKQSSVSKMNTQNILAEEDEIEFESCCGVETFEFVIPGKKYKVNIFIHSLLSGPLCGLGMWYLLPTTINGLYSTNTGATVVLFIFGWITLCIAQYSLTVGPPPEPAVFHSTDPYEITPLMRPFYVYVFEAFFLVARSYSSFVIVDQVLHIIFPFLTVFWIFGFLPPLDALFPWIIEQTLVFFLGGSHTAGDLRLICMVLVSAVEFVIVFLIAHFAKSALAVIITAACLGFIQSLDLAALINQLTSKVQKSKEKDSDRQYKLSTCNGFGWQWGWKECITYFILLLDVGAVSGLCNHFSDNTTSSLYNGLGYTVIGLLVVVKLLTDCQVVFVFFGLWRNILYPSSSQSTTKYQKRKDILHIVGYIRRFLLDLVCPLVMVAYLSLYLAPTSLSLPTNAFKITVGSVRALRWVWQSTTHSLLEISILHIINVAIGTSSTSWWSNLGMGIQLLIIGLCRDRLYQVMDQIYLVFAVLITSYSEKKQRRSSSLALMIVAICMLPIIFAVLCVTAALAAPLLPLFTLPIFLLGFPRPLRSWPGTVGASANICPDTIYYQQVAPNLAASLRSSLADGSLGDVHPGCHYLTRFQDRMVWLQVLEKGYGFCTFSVKGLEMQETSCHTVEAGRVDEIFETAFNQETGFSCFNKYPFHTLTAVDAIPVNTYSDARNVLTGIIDSPEVLTNVGKCFLQSLVWVLLHYNAQKSGKKSRPSTAKEKKEQGVKAIGYDRPKSANSLVHAVDLNETLHSSNDSGKPESMKSRPQSRAKSIKSWNSFGSLDSWADDNDSLALETLDNKKTNKVSLMDGYMANNTKKSSMQPTRKEAEIPGLMGDDDDDIDDLFNELDFGMPVMDVTKAKQQQQMTSFGLPASHAMPATGIRLAGSMQFNSPYSSKLSLPLKWREIPIEKNKISHLLDQFPTEWYKHVLTLLDLTTTDKTSEEVATEVLNDAVLMDIYTQLTMACYAVVNVLGLGGGNAVAMGASHVYKVYTGDVPWSPSLEWLNDDTELLQLVLKAYRYGFKLAYDQAVLGEIDSHEELAEYLQEYENDWYIGCEKDAEWSAAVLQVKNNLFSLVYDPVDAVYNGRVLTKQAVMAYIGRLNSEVVRGYWASLAQELFYFTNDDEERYSIQAHPVLLRNLTVQSADPPLGYPIYSSPPMSIPTL